MSKKKSNKPKLDTNEYIQLLYKELSRESDRGVAIISGVMLDDALKKSIMSRLRKPSGEDDAGDLDRIIKHDGLLGTQSAKEIFAYFMNIIGPITYHNLKTIRNIRNKFAHNLLEADQGRTVELLSFDHSNIANQVKTLKRTGTTVRHGYWLPKSSTDYRGRFISAVFEIETGLLNDASCFGKCQKHLHERSDNKKLYVYLPHGVMKMIRGVDADPDSIGYVLNDKPALD